MQPVDQKHRSYWRLSDNDWARIEADLGHQIGELEIEMQPAGAHAIRAAYDALADTYQQSRVEDASKRMRLWVMTFAEWPHCALQAAVKSWCLKDTAFMPSPGQFHACGASVIEAKRQDYADMRKILHTYHRPDDMIAADFEPDPDVALKLNRLRLALSRGEDVAALRKAREL